MKRKQRSVGGEYGAPWKQKLPGGGWGTEYFPISARSGRPVAQSTAERDYDNEHGAVDSSGLWDSETERKLHGPRRVPQTPARYDETEMAAFVARRGHALTAHEWEIYTLFWVQRRSYSTIARELGRNPARVYEAIKRLRVRMSR